MWFLASALCNPYPDRACGFEHGGQGLPTPWHGTQFGSCLRLTHDTSKAKQHALSLEFPLFSFSLIFSFQLPILLPLYSETSLRDASLCFVLSGSLHEFETCILTHEVCRVAWMHQKSCLVFAEAIGGKFRKISDCFHVW